jgi:hypothetical protein
MCKQWPSSLSTALDFHRYILCSRFVGSEEDEPGDPVDKRDLMESDLGTEDNEE